MNYKEENQIQGEDISSRKLTIIMLIIGIIFIAANLRAPLTSVGPLISLIREDLNISNTSVGMLTTLPLFALSFFSPFSPGLARKFGMAKVLFVSVIILTLGILLRSSFGKFGLFTGTVILGLAISVGNVLLPSLIKEEFPNQLGLMTGIYSVFMNIFAALASGISIPLAIGKGIGWTGALRIWAGLSLLASILWLPQLVSKKEKVSREEKVKGMARENILKSPLAWKVTFYMGLQSMIFYCMVAWMPDILINQGMEASRAGWTLSLMQLALIPMTFVGSVLAGRRPDQRFLVALGAGSTLVGLTGLLFLASSNFVYPFIIILGIGGGFNFSLAMMFFSLRTRKPAQAASLSGMGQSIGYLLAAFGPMFFGYLRDISHSWTLPLTVLLAMTILCWLSGHGASRDQYIG